MNALKNSEQAAAEDLNGSTTGKKSKKIRSEKKKLQIAHKKQTLKMAL